MDPELGWVGKGFKRLIINIEHFVLFSFQTKTISRGSAGFFLSMCGTVTTADFSEFVPYCLLFQKVGVGVGGGGGVGVGVGWGGGGGVSVSLAKNIVGPSESFVLAPHVSHNIQAWLFFWKTLVICVRSVAPIPAGIQEGFIFLVVLSQGHTSKEYIKGHLEFTIQVTTFGVISLHRQIQTHSA